MLTGCGARVPLAQGLARWDSVTQKLRPRWLPAVREVWEDGCRVQGCGGDSTAGWQGAWGPLLKPGPVGGTEGQQGWREVAGSLASPEHLKGSEVGSSRKLSVAGPVPQSPGRAGGTRPATAGDLRPWGGWRVAPRGVQVLGGCRWGLPPEGPTSHAPPHTGCERDRLSFGFCETLRLLGRCQLPAVRTQCCRSCPPPGHGAPSRGYQRVARR